jgi:predicted nucleic-acid-binding protein
MTREEFFKHYNDAMLNAITKYGAPKKEFVDTMDQDLKEYIMSKEYLTDEKDENDHRN